MKKKPSKEIQEIMIAKILKSLNWSGIRMMYPYKYYYSDLHSENAVIELKDLLKIIKWGVNRDANNKTKKSSRTNSREH
jgi:hypothetical protein